MFVCVLGLLTRMVWWFVNSVVLLTFYFELQTVYGFLMGWCYCGCLCYDACFSFVGGCLVSVWVCLP